jgi:hypothetical protein
MVAVEVVHLEIYTVKGLVLDNLYSLMLQDMLKQVDMKAGSQYMELLMLMWGLMLALEEEHNAHLIPRHFYQEHNAHLIPRHLYPSFSSGRHKKTKHNSILRRQQRKIISLSPLLRHQSA